MEEPRVSTGRILHSVGIVAVTLMGSVFLFQNVWGLLSISDLPSALLRGVLLMTGVTLAVSQFPASRALSRRVGPTMVDHVVVSGSLFLATLTLLILTATSVR